MHTQRGRHRRWLTSKSPTAMFTYWLRQSKKKKITDSQSSTSSRWNPFGDWRRKAFLMESSTEGLETMILYSGAITGQYYCFAHGLAPKNVYCTRTYFTVQNRDNMDVKCYLETVICATHGAFTCPEGEDSDHHPPSLCAIWNCIWAELASGRLCMTQRHVAVIRIQMHSKSTPREERMNGTFVWSFQQLAEKEGLGFPIYCCQWVIGSARTLTFLRDKTNQEQC